MKNSNSVTAMQVGMIISIMCMTSCSGGDVGMVMGNIGDESGMGDGSVVSDARMGVGHVLMGLYDVTFDLETGEVWVEPDRAAAGHYNVTEFLMPPYCDDCFIVSIVSFDPVNREIVADVTVKNFTRGLTGYDVRGIVYPVEDILLTNAYAYTLLYAPPGITDPSGFRAYLTDDPDRDMTPDESATERFELTYPEGAKLGRLTFAVDASWPDHCPEPYDIHDFQQNPLDATPGSTALVSVYVSDWQDDAQGVTIDTDAFGGTEVALTHDSGELWTGEISNVLGFPDGHYPCLITARDPETVHHLFQWVEVEIVDTSDHDPPVWDGDVGITDVAPGLTGVLAWFGSASDPSEPVTYNLYYSVTDPIDFETASVVTGIEESPYLLLDLAPTVYYLCIRAVDGVGNETTNTESTSVEIGVHPNIYWQSGPDMTVARGYAGGFLADGYFWVPGGSSAGTQLDVVERYDLVGGTWDSPWSLPEARDGFGCGTLDGMAYVFGGRFGETDVTDSCHVINLDDGGCVLSPPTLPMPLATMGCAFMDGTFYLAGGRHFTGFSWEFHREAFKLTPPSNTFEGETDLEFETSTMGFAAGDGYLMSCGGHPDRQDVLHHVPETKSWQWRAPIVPGRDGNVSVWVNGWLYSFGGNCGSSILDLVDVLDVEDDTWYSINPMINPRAVAVVDTDGEHVYIAGGVTSVKPVQTPTATFEIGQIY